MSYYFYDNQPYLMHFGVKGMKWGVRKDRARSRGSKKPLTAAQKAERKRKLIKGAKIAAAALGTAAVIGGTAYARKKGSEYQSRIARDRQNAELRRHAENIERIMYTPIGRIEPDGSYRSLMGTVRSTASAPANETYDEAIQRTTRSLERMGINTSGINWKTGKRRNW